jgi:hypothetical protein
MFFIALPGFLLHHLVVVETPFSREALQCWTYTSVHEYLLLQATQKLPLMDGG